MSNLFSIRKSLVLAGTTVGLVLAFLPAAEARGFHSRPHVQDHRGGGRDLGGSAIPGGPRIKCVIFCGNTFTPSGANPRSHAQDHRPGTPIVDNNGNHVGNLPIGGTRSDLNASGRNPRYPGYQNPYYPPGSHPGGASGMGGVGGRPHVQDHRGQGSTPIVLPGRPISQPGRPAPGPVIDPGTGGGHSHANSGPLRTPLVIPAAYTASSESCTYESRRIQGVRRQVKVCAAD